MKELLKGFLLVTAAAVLGGLIIYLAATNLPPLISRQEPPAETGRPEELAQLLKQNQELEQQNRQLQQQLAQLQELVDQLRASPGQPETKGAKQPVQPPLLRQDEFCQSRQAGLPVGEALVDFRYQQNANKVVVVADPGLGRGFFQCLVLTMSPRAQERFNARWPGQTTPEVLFIKCFQYRNRSECLIPSDALEVYDEGWVFGFNSQGGQLSTFWGISRIQLGSRPAP